MKFGLQKEGYGVSKNERTRSRALMFFIIYFNRYWKLMGLNLLFIITCIPVVTIGPATAAMMYILKKYTQEETASIWQDYWLQFRANFKQAFPFGLLSLASYALLSFALYFYTLQAKIDPVVYILVAICALALVILTFINFYAYLFMVTVELPLSKILKNSAIMALTNLKSNLIALFIIVILAGIIMIFLMMSLMALLLILVIGPMTAAYVVSFLCYPNVKKIFVDPHLAKREQNHETKTIFKDTIE